ncbi:unnamed protein product, partial [Brenthis ino]
MDNDDYSHITSQLDAREILRYLNNLGIRNISGEVLKYFITDLKKLIKYDLQHKNEDQSARTHKSDSIGPERLHSASTFSSRIKSKVQDTDIVCNRMCQKIRKLPNIRTTYSAPNLGNKKEEENLPRRACSCVRIEKKRETTKEPHKVTLNNNFIKIPKQPIRRKNDPVALYHYYTSLWAKYKPNVPGENNWSDLRWNIRQKMVGNIGSQTSTKVVEK